MFATRYLFLILSFLILSIATIQNTFAFTLITNINANFDSDETSLYVTSNSTCTNAGVSAEELLSIAVDAADKFWNRVPSSYFKINKGGIFSTSDAKFTSGILCVQDSESSCDSSTSVPAVTDIVIACNSDTSTNFTSDSIVAITVPNNFSSKKIAGSVILINDAHSSFANLSRSEKVNVLGHEIGHAIGLGHSPDDAALMYDSEFSNRERLGQDDIDGITYLYPNKLNGCTGIFGTMLLIGKDDDQGGKGNGPFATISKETITFITTAIAGIFLAFLMGTLGKKITLYVSRSRQIATS